ncbi:unnamed protein product [Sphenostylis stenocarpa]|uniref:Uncharacterized protein n=1 Tax=Sphenostylis stenocarpa TaxID=92480 RepID=A0AA86VWJ0_9FABA|nr:unnamed protein product [Sphenostylis stenocarpa]
MVKKSGGIPCAFWRSECEPNPLSDPVSRVKLENRDKRGGDWKDKDPYLSRKRQTTSVRMHDKVAAVQVWEFVSSFVRSFVRSYPRQSTPIPRTDLNRGIMVILHGKVDSTQWSTQQHSNHCHQIHQNLYISEALLRWQEAKVKNANTHGKVVHCCR